MAYDAIKQIKSRNKAVIAVGGTALYIKALLYGLFDGPGSDSQIRENLRELAKTEGPDQLWQQLKAVDPAAADRIHRNDSKRIIRALEVYQISGEPISNLQKQFSAEKTLHDWTIVGLGRQKTDVAGKINQRVRKMIADGLVDEVKSLLAEDRPLSDQARCAIGYAEIIDYLNGKTSLKDAVERIKINTRRLAKGQRTWFKTFRNVNWLDIAPEEPLEKILRRTKELLNI